MHSVWKSLQKVSFYNIASVASYVYFQIKYFWIFALQKIKSFLS